MLDTVKVDVYGQLMPVNQLATISVPEARLISIQVWDKGLVVSVEKSIQESGLGLNPQTDGQLVRIPVPELNEERRTELKKLIKSIGEKCKVSIRNIRREANDEIKRLLKSKELSEDDEKKADILAFYYKLKDNHEKIVNYFNDYEIYLSKTPLKSFTKGVINHKF